MLVESTVMKTIKTTCYHCKASFEFPGAHIGMHSACPACGTINRLAEPVRWYVYPLFAIGLIWTLGMIIGTLIALWTWLSNWVYTG